MSDENRLERLPLEGDFRTAATLQPEDPEFTLRSDLHLLEEEDTTLTAQTAQTAQNVAEEQEQEQEQELKAKLTLESLGRVEFSSYSPYDLSAPLSSPPVPSPPPSPTTSAPTVVEFSSSASTNSFSDKNLATAIVALLVVVAGVVQLMLLVVHMELHRRYKEKTKEECWVVSEVPGLNIINQYTSKRAFQHTLDPEHEFAFEVSRPDTAQVPHPLSIDMHGMKTNLEPKTYDQQNNDSTGMSEQPSLEAEQLENQLPLNPTSSAPTQLIESADDVAASSHPDLTSILTLSSSLTSLASPSTNILTTNDDAKIDYVKREDLPRGPVPLESLSIAQVQQVLAALDLKKYTDQFANGGLNGVQLASLKVIKDLHECGLTLCSSAARTLLRFIERANKVGVEPRYLGSTTTSSPAPSPRRNILTRKLPAPASPTSPSATVPLDSLSTDQVQRVFVVLGLKNYLSQFIDASLTGAQLASIKSAEQMVDMGLSLPGPSTGTLLRFIERANKIGVERRYLGTLILTETTTSHTDFPLTNQETVHMLNPVLVDTSSLSKGRQTVKVFGLTLPTSLARLFMRVTKPEVIANVNELSSEAPIDQIDHSTASGDISSPSLVQRSITDTYTSSSTEVSSCIVLDYAERV